MVQHGVGGLDGAHRLMQHPAQCQLFRVEPVEALVVGAVVHSSVPSMRSLVLLLLLFLLLAFCLLASLLLRNTTGPEFLGPETVGRGPVRSVAHTGSSMAMRSAAIPREPYAFTEPSDTPSVSATWASVMSAK